LYVDRANFRFPRGPAAGASGGSSSLFCVDESLEADSPENQTTDNDEDAIDYQRRSFEQLIIARSKQSLERGDMFVLVEIGVQTEPVRLINVL
jgi:hypothetical protein